MVWKRRIVAFKLCSRAKPTKRNRWQKGSSFHASGRSKYRRGHGPPILAVPRCLCPLPPKQRALSSSSHSPTSAPQWRYHVPFPNAIRLIDRSFLRWHDQALPPSSNSYPPINGKEILNNWPKWRNWQTRYIQGVVPVRAWRFESSLRHQPTWRRRPKTKALGRAPVPEESESNLDTGLASNL